VKTLTSRPLLTIVIPSFNQREFIQQCLAEPLRLRPRGVEVIVMDGASTDGTAELLQESLRNDHCWRSEKDRGQAHAINKGFHLALGEWIAFQNSDDFYLPGKLELILNILKENPTSDVVIGGMASVDVTGKPFRVTSPKPILFVCLSQFNFINNQSFFVRREFLQKVGFLDEKLHFCLDYDWFVRILRARPRVTYVRTIIGAQRYHDNTKTNSRKDLHDSEFAVLTRNHFSVAERLAGLIFVYPYRLFRLLYDLFHTSK
jgi:glycosyltransferase involved in cell wall biosynthesis